MAAAFERGAWVVGGEAGMEASGQAGERGVQVACGVGAGRARRGAPQQNGHVHAANKPLHA